MHLYAIIKSRASIFSCSALACHFSWSDLSASTSSTLRSSNSEASFSKFGRVLLSAARPRASINSIYVMFMWRSLVYSSTCVIMDKFHIG